MSEIRMDYDMMEQMIQVLRQSAQQLEDTVGDMQNVATVLENGALLGMGGDAFSDAIRSNLCPAVSRLIERCRDRAEYAQTEMDDHREAQRRAGGLFG
jgi:uncharacterized protein YukE